MPTIYCDDDADLAVIQSRNVTLLGDGDQLLASALCLRDSGVDVRLGLAGDAAIREEAEAEGLRLLPPYEAGEEADLYVLLGCGEAPRAAYAESVAPNLVRGDAVLVGHGADVRYGHIKPPQDVDLCMVAPLGSGEQLRADYCAGRGAPALVAVERDASGSAWDLTLSYARAIGATKAGALASSVTDEAEVSAFADEAVLRGGVPQLVEAAFETLMDAGYSPELAWLRCVVGLRETVDRLLTDGVGAVSSGRRVLDPSVAARLGELLTDVRAGKAPERASAQAPIHRRIDAVAAELQDLLASPSER